MGTEYLNSTPNLKIAEQMFSLYVSRLHSSTSEKYIIEFVFENGVKLLAIKSLISRRTTNFKSHKVCINKKDCDTVLKDGSLPEGKII